MAAVRIQRMRSVSWKPNWHETEEGRILYLGKWRIGKVVREVRNRRVCYTGYLHVPHIYGPVSREATQLLATQALMDKVTEWLEGFSDDAPAHAEAENTARRRTRTR